MKPYILALLFPLLFFVGCSSLKVSTDYDPEIALGSFDSFAVLDTKDVTPHTLQGDRIVKAITEELESKGYRAAGISTATFHVRYKTHTEEDVPGNFSFGFGFGGFSGHTGASIGTSTSPRSDKGILLIEMLSPSSQKVLWRGTASDTLKKNDTPQEREANIRYLVGKILETFPKRSAE